MKINLDLVVDGFDGQPVKNADGSQLTLKRVFTTALLGSYTSERGGPGATVKVQRYMLAKAINAGGVQDIAPEQLVALKNLVGMAWTTEVVGAVVPIINGTVSTFAE